MKELLNLVLMLASCCIVYARINDAVTIFLNYSKEYQADIYKVEANTLCSFFFSLKHKGLLASGDFTGKAWNCSRPHAHHPIIGDPCQESWTGIQCEDKRIVSIGIFYRAIAGTVPSTFNMLEKLTFLSIQGNEMTGKIPSSLSSLELTRLDLSLNNMEGTIPPEIGYMTTLTRLYLSHNKLSGSIPTSLGNAKSLYRLRLASNKLEGSLPSILSNLRELTELHLEGNSLQGSIPLEICTLPLSDITGGSNDGTFCHSCRGDRDQESVWAESGIPLCI